MLAVIEKGNLRFLLFWSVSSKARSDEPYFWQRQVVQTDIFEGGRC